MVTFDPRAVLEKMRVALPDALIAVEEPGVGFKVSKHFPDGELMGHSREVTWDELIAHPVTRVTLRQPEATAEEFMELVERAGLHGVSYAVGWSAWLDINPEGVSKASALELVRRQLRVEPIHTVACGDQRNDLEMLHWAAWGVAMDNAPDQVKAVADEVTGHVDDDGLAPDPRGRGPGRARRRPLPRRRRVGRDGPARALGFVGNAAGACREPAVPFDVGVRRGPRPRTDAQRTTEETTMRFMIIVPASPETEQGPTGTEQQFADMQAYNEQMLKAGVFVDGAGPAPDRQGRARHVGGRRLGRHRRALRRGQGAHRRLHDHRRQLARGGPRVAQEVARVVRARARARRSSCARSSRPRTSATSSPPSCASARSRCAPRPPATRPAPDPSARPPAACVREWRGVTDHRPAHRRRRAHARGGLAHGGRQGDGRRRPRSSATSASPRTSRRTRSCRPSSSGPATAYPNKPGAWLTSTARRRAIDRIRRDVNLASKLQQVGHLEELRVAELAEGDFDAALRGHRRRRPRPDLRRVPSRLSPPRRGSP